ncbi:TetR/AcrR family transcriptional regulator [Micromonospora sp. NPDC048830]|uniref:TetR/AcrR family transcriptional regulator n=1 Tax=Micromonospora sp. NPDC048830 TaxID=3364257 RepID=UPI0037182999
MTLPTGHVTPARRRPSDRRRQILAAAARQFWSVGYNQASMADIAAAVGIGASALYRHFRGKQDLLVAVLDETLVQLEEAASTAEDLVGTTRKLAGIAVERREFGALWDRDAAHLPDNERRRVRERLRAVVTGTAEFVATELGIPSDDARLRTHALYAVLASPSRHHAELDSPNFENLLVNAASSTLHVRTALAAEPSSRRTVRGNAPQLPASRREAILATSIRLFGEYGYPSVGLTDIGTATGIAGPSIYNHFASKTEILVAALTRGNEALWLALHHALAVANSAQDALDRLLDSYVAFAAENPSVISVLISEVINLPAEHRDSYHHHQKAYVHEWVSLLRQSRPEIHEAQARILVHATLALVNDLVRIRGFQRRSNLTAEIAALGRSVLRTSAPEPGR